MNLYGLGSWCMCLWQDQVRQQLRGHISDIHSIEIEDVDLESAATPSGTDQAAEASKGLVERHAPKEKAKLKRTPPIQPITTFLERIQEAPDRLRR